jgi:hypothetical protein
MIYVYNWVSNDGSRSDNITTAVEGAIKGAIKGGYKTIANVQTIDEVPEPYRTKCMLIDAAEGILAGVGECGGEGNNIVYWLEDGFVPDACDLSHLKGK